MQLQMIVTILLVLSLKACLAQKSDYFEGKKTLQGIHLRYHARNAHLSTDNISPVNVADLSCFVCDQEDDPECGDSPTLEAYLKSCKTVIPATNVAFGSEDQEGSLRRTYLCYKKYNPVSKTISRSCQTSYSLPEWNGVSGCTLSRHSSASGRVGSRCICNSAACNGGELYVPPREINTASQNVKWDALTILVLFPVILYN